MRARIELRRLSSKRALRDRAVSRPLALYLFEHSKRRVERVLQETISKKKMFLQSS